MMGYMNREAVQRTLQSGQVSRSGNVAPAMNTGLRGRLLVFAGVTERTQEVKRCNLLRHEVRRINDYNKILAYRLTDEQMLLIKVS